MHENSKEESLVGDQKVRDKILGRSETQIHTECLRQSQNNKLLVKVIRAEETRVKSVNA